MCSGAEALHPGSTQPWLLGQGSPQRPGHWWPHGSCLGQRWLQGSLQYTHASRCNQCAPAIVCSCVPGNQAAMGGCPCCRHLPVTRKNYAFSEKAYNMLSREYKKQHIAAAIASFFEHLKLKLLLATHSCWDLVQYCSGRCNQNLPCFLHQLSAMLHR